MKPYVNEERRGTGKIVPHNGGGHYSSRGTTKLAKLIAKNANRGRKKAHRQYEKLMLRRHVEELANEPIYEAEAIIKTAELDDLSHWRKKGILLDNINEPEL